MTKDINHSIVGIVGTGLIGTSLALALKDCNAKQSILGYDTDEMHARQAMERGAFDGFRENPLALAKQCDILVISTPIGAVRSIFEQIKDIAERIVITDVGSVKSSIIIDACSVWGKMPARMVPAHPIAGTENSGPVAASKDLFVLRYVFLTPGRKADEVAMDVVRDLWSKVGAKIEILSAAQHDELFAATSHLPHIVAYALINSLEQAGVNTGFSAGGLKDFTRIAASNPTMWRDIFIANESYLLDSIKTFERSMRTIRKLIEKKHGDKLLNFLEKTVAEKKSLNLKD